MKHLILWFCLSFLLSQQAQAQQWVRMMEERKSNFYRIQQEFNDYWKDRNVGRGKGWKPFKRWEYFWEPRVYPTGEFPAPDRAAKAFQTYMNSLPGSGVFKNNADQAAWSSMGPERWETISYNPGIGRINCVARDPLNSNLLYAGAPSGGFWKSLDGGQHWYTTTDNQTVLGVSSIAVHPLNPNIIFIATGDGDAGDNYSIGVLKSTDGGESWQQTGLQWDVTEAQRISKLLINPDNPDIMLAAANNGIYKSINGGMDWVNVQAGNFKDMEFKPADPSIVYAAGSRFYKSVNSGDSFAESMSGINQLLNIQRIAIAVTQANPDYVYLLISDNISSGFFGFYRSENSGSSFIKRSDSPNILSHSADGSGEGGQGWYDLAVAVSPNNAEEVFAGGVNVWKSYDGGVNWELNCYWYYPNDYQYVHADIHSLDFYGTDIYSASDGGVYVSGDDGVSWTNLTFGLSTMQFYRFSGYPADANLLLGGTQDNGTNRFKDNIWTHVFGSDGMETAINYNNPDTMYASYYYGGIMRSADGGESFYGIKGEIDEDGGWVTPYVLHPQNPQTLFAAYVNVWKSDNGGDNWTKISDFSGGTLRLLAVAKSDPQVIYTGTGNTLYRSSDGGAEWTDISSGLPTSQASMTYAAVADDDADKVWVSFSGFADGQKIYATQDGGYSWSNISGTLPNLPVQCIVYQKNYHDALYIGTDLGVYYKDSTLADWQPYMNGLPNVIVKELEIHYDSGMLRAATYGRGVWQTPLKSLVSAISPPASQLVKSFHLFQNYPNPFNPGTTIEFELEQNARVRLLVYDVNWKVVRQLIDGWQGIGVHSVTWDGNSQSGKAVAGGVYFYELNVGSQKETRKMLLLK